MPKTPAKSKAKSERAPRRVQYVPPPVKTPPPSETDREYFLDKLPPEEAEWFRDERYARYGLEDGIFDVYHPGVIAIHHEQVVGRGKNPKLLRRRVAKKLKVHPLQVILVDTCYGIL